MGTITVRQSKSLPVTFFQREGDRHDAATVVHGAADVSMGKGNVAKGLLSILGRHWDTLAQVSPAPSSPEAAEKLIPGGERAWNKATGLPLIRSMVAVAYGQEVGELAEQELKPYFSKLAQGAFWGVSPFQADTESLMTWAEYTKAIAAKRGKESGDKAIIRGIGTFIRSDADGNLSTPSIEDMRAARRSMSDDMIKALALFVAGTLDNDEISKGRSMLNAQAQRDATETAGILVEGAE